MALIKCSECGKDVSDRAAACPNCGNPIRSGQQGFVGSSAAGPSEGDVKRGVQRAKGRYELGYAIGVVGFVFGLIVGAATGSWLLGIGLGVAALIGGIIFQYA